MAPAPAPAHILRLPLTGTPGSHVLVRAVPHASQSSGPLDLELTATDDEQAYVRTLQHSKISRLREPNSSLSEEQWEQCLTSLLLPGSPPLGHLDVTAQLKDEETLIISIQDKVSGQPEPVGTLTLRASESATESIDIFDWCSDAVEVRSQLETELVELRRKHAHLESLVAEEAAHFRDLERSKDKFEAEHDSFLRDLLNEKKLKIRTQGQVLSTARVDEDKLAAVTSKAKKASGPGAAPKRRGAVGASRKGKRKAATPDGDDAVADMMDVDDPDVGSPGHEADEQELSDAGRTTEGSETASESEPEPEPERKKPDPASAHKKGARASPSLPSRNRKAAADPPSSNLRGSSATAAPSDGGEDEDEDEDDKVPPPRALPFKKKPAPAPAPVDDESTASEASES